MLGRRSNNLLSKILTRSVASALAFALVALGSFSAPYAFGAGAKKAGAGGREKHIIREGRTKKGDKQNIDFEATDIGGERKSPLGTLVNNNKYDKNYNFVKIRLRWPNEMIQSASSLDSGNGGSN